MTWHRRTAAVDDAHRVARRCLHRRMPPSPALPSLGPTAACLLGPFVVASRRVRPTVPRPRPRLAVRAAGIRKRLMIACVIRALAAVSCARPVLAVREQFGRSHLATTSSESFRSPRTAPHVRSQPDRAARIHQTIGVSGAASTLASAAGESSPQPVLVATERRGRRRARRRSSSDGHDEAQPALAHSSTGSRFDAYQRAYAAIRFALSAASRAAE